MGLKDFNETFRSELGDQLYSAELLTDCLNEETVDTFLVGLLELVKQRGGMTWLAKETGLNRESLYKTLAVGANPEFRTIVAILKAVNISMNFSPACKPVPSAVEEPVHA